MSRNKHMKIVADADTLTGIAAGIGRTSKRVTSRSCFSFELRGDSINRKENFLCC